MREELKTNRTGGKLLEAINTATILKLLEAGKAVCPTDYAVKYYYNKKHPKFHLNKEALLKAIRRAYGQNAFNHRERLANILFNQ